MRLSRKMLARFGVRLPRRIKGSRAGPSHLEEKFARLWAQIKGPPLEREARFMPDRLWRFDFAHTATRTAIEIEGGVWGGRHTRGAGFEKDCEKYLAAHLHRWNVVRLSPKLITAPNLTALALLIALKENRPLDKPTAT